MKKLTFVIIEEQKSMINFTQFKAKDTTKRQWNKILIMIMVWRMQKLKSSRKMLTGLKSHMNATNATMHLPIQAIWGHIWKAQWRKVKQMQPMWQCILSDRPFENTFDNTQWRKAKQVQSMWILILFYKRFEDPFQNKQWRKVKQMQPMWFCIASWGRKFVETFQKRTQWRIKNMNM